MKIWLGTAKLAYSEISMINSFIRSPEEEGEEVFSEEEIKLPADDDDEDEEKQVHDDGEDGFRTTDHLEAANSQVTNWHEQEN